MSTIIETTTNDNTRWLWLFLSVVVIIKYLVDAVKSFVTADMSKKDAQKWSRKWSYLIAIPLGILSGLLVYIEIDNTHILFFLGAGLAAGLGAVNFHELGNLIQTWTGVDISFRPFNKEIE